MVTVPPSAGMASRAFTTRLTIAFEIWPSSARTAQRSGDCSNLRLTRSPSSRRSRSDSSVIVSASASTSRLQGLLAREREQLAHQPRGAHRVLPHLVDLGERRIAGRVAHQQQIAIADDRLEQIVEVVRDAARELADRLHLLRLRELGLERLLLGGVDEIEDRLRRAHRARDGRDSRRAARCDRPSWRRPRNGPLRARDWSRPQPLAR